jgi:hypothetical protein
MITIIRNDGTTFLPCETQDDYSLLMKTLDQDDYEFIVFNERSRAFALIRDILPEKVIILYGLENSVLPLTNGIKTVACWPNEKVMNALGKQSDPLLYVSRLGFCHRSYERWRNRDDYRTLVSKITKLKDNVQYNRVMFYGTRKRGLKTDGVTRREAELIEIGKTCELVYMKIEPLKPLLDYLIENKCFAMAGADGGCIGTYRDHELPMSFVPSIRATLRPEFADIADPYKVAYVGSLSGDMPAAISRLKDDLSSGSIFDRLWVGRYRASQMSKNFQHYRAIEALCLDHEFLLDNMGTEFTRAAIERGRASWSSMANLTNQ